jgi:Ca-activated chloride channel family protein
LLTAGGLLAILALANPTWEQQPQPLLQTSTSRVIVFDLSRSMLATDIKPSRLVRARFKVEDILNNNNEGQTGLVVFAGDAFTVSPLTRDTDTIRAQLKSLDPSIMPVQGSRADLGLLKARELLQQAGIPAGQVILIADGVEGDSAARTAKQLRKSGYRVSVLGVGTADGAPLPDGQAGVTRDATGKTMRVRLDRQALESVARSGGGRFTELSGSAADVRYLLAATADKDGAQQTDDRQARRWIERGPLLAALLLPLAALAFRRGWLISLLLCAGLLVPPRPAMAFGWDDLWQRRDQQAATALQQQQFEQAAKLADDPLQRGSAKYRQGDYKQAAASFSKAPGADAAYNMGNSLARLGEYRKAIEAYDKALEQQPGMEDAAANKAAVEALLKQQQAQQKPSGQPNSQQGANQDSAGNDSRSGNNKASGQNQGNKEDASSSGQDSHQTESAKQPSAAPQQKDSANQFADANKKLDAENRGGQQESADRNPPDTSISSPDVTQAPAAEQQGSEEQPAAGKIHAAAAAEDLSSEEELAAQQWLRRIPDDPGGLLRRKFLYQYQQRARQSDNDSLQDW